MLVLKVIFRLYATDTKAYSNGWVQIVLLAKEPLIAIKKQEDEDNSYHGGRYGKKTALRFFPVFRAAT